MTAPELRPTATTGAASPMETGPDHQLEHLFEPRVGGGEEVELTIGNGPVAAYVCRRCRKFCSAPVARECMAGCSSGCPMVAPETLAKVLPAGGPLLGQEPCPSCGHSPGEARDNPFRSCRACGYHAP